MTNALVQRLVSKSPREMKKLAGFVGRVKTVASFLSDTISALKGNSVAAAIGEAVPWAGLAAESLADAAPPVKFAFSLLDQLGKVQDPEVLAHLACTIAYQRSIEQAATELPPPTATALAKTIQRTIDILAEAEDAAPKIKGMTIGGVSQLPFVDTAEALLIDFAKVVGYTQERARELARNVRVRFPTNFKLLLSHGSTRAKFVPLTQYLELGGGQEELVQDALQLHADYQRRQFEEHRVLGGEPFSLAHVYVDVECGVLTWKQLRGMKDPRDEKLCRPDAFNERFGDRHPLMKTVVDLLEDPNFRDAIVVQGVAGSGKSTFTLRLCSELVHRGLRPIRVRLRDISFDRHARDSLPRAVKLRGEVGDDLRLPEPDHLFSEGKIFKERVQLKSARICPYVLILDGWDEISVSTDAGFRKRVTEFLQQVRAEYLDRDPIVRVVVTGRPSADVTHESSGFFDDRTKVLTIRPLRPRSLNDLVTKISRAVEEAPLKWDGDRALRWDPPSLPVRGALIARYAEGFENATKAQARGQSAESSRSLPIVGLPLLAHMTVRLLASELGDVEHLLNNPTTLYRHLTDLTCSTAAAHPSAILGKGDRPRIEGANLRGLLHLTATAMTIEGEDSISEVHLRARIKRLGEQSKLGELSLAQFADAASKEFPIAKLMVSYFFKGGRSELGCEFAHKSFREYLFAEGLVEVLKDYGRQADGSPSPRAAWWRDFQPSDLRFKLSRALGPRLSAQWLTQDVADHLDGLLCWEIERARGESETVAIAQETAVLTWEQWTRVRDGVAALWAWWAEGAHLRPQVEEETERPRWQPDSLYAEQLVRLAYPITLNGTQVPAPVRTTTIDAHLGDGLFRICARVHAEMLPPPSSVRRAAIDQGWWNGYQTREVSADNERLRFRPGGPPPRSFFGNLAARINAAGWRIGGQFPGRLFAVDMDLRRADLLGADLNGANLQDADLFGANLGGADLIGANFIRAYLRAVNLSRADLRAADLRHADLTDAQLMDAQLVDANLQGANLRNADLTGADLTGADLTGADLTGAVLPE